MRPRSQKNNKQINKKIRKRLFTKILRNNLPREYPGREDGDESNEDREQARQERHKREAISENKGGAQVRERRRGNVATEWVDHFPGHLSIFAPSLSLAH